MPLRGPGPQPPPTGCPPRLTASSTPRSRHLTPVPTVGRKRGQEPGPRPPGPTSHSRAGCWANESLFLKLKTSRPPRPARAQRRPAAASESGPPSLSCVCCTCVSARRGLPSDIGAARRGVLAARHGPRRRSELGHLAGAEGSAVGYRGHTPPPRTCPARQLHLKAGGRGSGVPWARGTGKAGPPELGQGGGEQ